MNNDLDNETILLFNNNELSEDKLEKIFALKALNENKSLFENNWFAFEKLSNVLNDIKPNINILEPISILQASKAIKILTSKFEFSPGQEVRQYIAYIAHEEGWTKLPDILNLCQNELDLLQPQNIELDDEQMKIQNLKHMAVKKYLESE